MTAQRGRAVPWDAVEQRRRDKAAKAPGIPQDTSGCKGPTCSSLVRWAITVAGERMPVDLQPDPDGKLVRTMVAPGDWRIRVIESGEELPAGTLRWTSHYATCPDAEWFRARGKTRDAGVPERHPGRRRPAAVDEDLDDAGPRRRHAQAPPFTPDDPRPSCPSCGNECAAELPLAELEHQGAGSGYVLTGELVLVDGQHPLGELHAVLTEAGWAVRRVDGERYLRPADRRRVHACPVYRGVCMICGGPANLYPCGWRCPEHRPQSRRALIDTPDTGTAGQ